MSNSSISFSSVCSTCTTFFSFLTAPLILSLYNRFHVYIIHTFPFSLTLGTTNCHHKHCTCQQPFCYQADTFIGLKLLTRLRLGLSHLNEHRFNHNFQNCINPLCTCSLEVESTAHFFLHCHHYHNIRAKLLNSLEVIDTNLLKLSEEQLIKVLLYYSSQLDQNQNRNVLNSSINYIVIMSPSPPGIRGGG